MASCTANSRADAPAAGAEPDSVLAAEPAYDELPASLAEAPIPAELMEPEPAAPRTAAPSTTASNSQGGSRTLYVSTHGAQGEVWGHVRMNGNTGRGTIHDHNENTLSITVTRHGNELYGTDQNGRQYVFKL